MDFWAAATAGALGGFALGLCVLVLNLTDTLRSSTPHPRSRRILWTHLSVAFILAGVGGIAAHFLTGQSGDFLQGVTAVGFLLLIGGSALGHTGAAHA